MRLTEQNPKFLGAGGEGVWKADGSPAPRREGVGLMFDCPCGCGGCTFVDFANPLDGAGQHRLEARAVWQRTGETFETLTLTPSILIHSSSAPDTCKGWHGYLTNGELLTC